MSINEKMTALADKIRGYTGGTDKLGLDDMAAQVDKVAIAIPLQLIQDAATTVVIPEPCRKIRAYAFDYSKSLKSVLVESSRLNGVYSQSFLSCSALEEFRLVSKCNLRRFGNLAFAYCSKLKVIDLSLYSGSDIPVLDSADAFKGVHKDCEIFVPAPLYEQWVATYPWDEVAHLIKIKDAPPAPEECDHNWVTKTVVEPTCTEQGKAERSCSKCGQTEAAGTIAPLGHEYDPNSECSYNDAVHFYTCIRCGEPMAETEEEHVMSDWVEDGDYLHRRDCEYCGYSEVDAHDIDGDMEIETEPTCTEDGDGYHVCATCGHIHYEDGLKPIQAYGHVFIEVKDKKNPTCTEDGYRILRCSNCPETSTETIPALGHSYVDETVLIWGGDAWGHVCTRCGHEEFESWVEEE